MFKWWKVLGGIVLGSLLVAAVAVTALAQGPDTDGDGVRDLFGQGRGPAYGFVDEDGDGVNDRAAEFVDEDGDGVCDVCGEVPGQGYGRNADAMQNRPWGRGQGMGGYGFVDEDGDGVNDRAAEFVDDDGDGLCDEHGVAPRENAGAGHGWRRAR